MAEQFAMLALARVVAAYSQAQNAASRSERLTLANRTAGAPLDVCAHAPPQTSAATIAADASLRVNGLCFFEVRLSISVLPSWAGGRDRHAGSVRRWPAESHATEVLTRLKPRPKVTGPKSCLREPTRGVDSAHESTPDRDALRGPRRRAAVYRLAREWDGLDLVL